MNPPSSSESPITPPDDFRSPEEVSWRTSLIVTPARAAAVAKAVGEAQAHTSFAETAFALGYRFVVVGSLVLEVSAPKSANEKPALEVTEMTVEDGSFVLYVVHKNLVPLSQQQKPLLFVNPAIARFQAARNGGEVMRVDQWAKESAAKARSRIIAPGSNGVGSGIILPPSR